MSGANGKSAGKPATKTAEAVLGYLQHRMPAYPFDPKLDDEFVRELIDDFAAEVDILEETKGFRWFYSQPPGPQPRTIRLSLRRWIASARRRHYGTGVTKPKRT